jgi:hypothetical protein
MASVPVAARLPTLANQRRERNCRTRLSLLQIALPAVAIYFLKHG